MCVCVCKRGEGRRESVVILWYLEVNPRNFLVLKFCFPSFCITWLYQSLTFRSGYPFQCIYNLALEEGNTNEEEERKTDQNVVDGCKENGLDSVDNAGPYSMILKYVSNGFCLCFVLFKELYNAAYLLTQLAKLKNRLYGRVYFCLYSIAF